MEPITLQSMGEALHISPYYLSHVFKQMSGYIRPCSICCAARIGEAQTPPMIDLSTTRIAEDGGYDTSYFNLQFTKNVGMLPNKFRQNYIVSTGIEEKPSATQ